MKVHVKGDIVKKNKKYFEQGYTNLAWLYKYSRAKDWTAA